MGEGASAIPALGRCGCGPEVVSRLLLEYDGARFAGWAWQPNARTVQAEVERALAILLRRSDRVPVTVAGRTDAGVHALGQVASYNGPPVPVVGLNALLPADVAALAQPLRAASGAALAPCAGRERAARVRRGAGG